MSYDHTTNWRAEAITAIEVTESVAANAAIDQRPLVYGQLAVAKANLAMYDALLALRDEVETLPARIEKRLSD